jgi:hypothetical protein
MNRFLKIFAVIILTVIAVLSTVTLYRFFSSADEVQIVRPADTTSTIDLVQQAITPVSDDTFSSGNIVIHVDDFMNNGKTFEDPMNPGNYILSEDIGYCPDGADCVGDIYASNFTIWFDGTDGVFYVRLLEQPIRTARLDAEQFLQRTLELSPPQLCDLDYYMSVSEYTDARFAGQHLQFSACIGSQTL